MRKYKKVVLVGFILLGIIALGLGMSMGQQDSELMKGGPTPTSVAQSQLSFSPSEATFTETKQVTMDVVLDTRSNNVTGVQLEMLYDPEIIADLTITPGPFLTNGTNEPENLINKIDAKGGRATYALVLPLSQEAVKGKGVIATLTITQRTLPTTITDTTTTIQLLRSSLVTAEGIRKSVLQSTSNATITLHK